MFANFTTSLGKSAVKTSIVNIKDTVGMLSAIPLVYVASQTATRMQISVSNVPKGTTLNVSLGNGVEQSYNILRKFIEFFSLNNNTSSYLVLR